MHSFEVEEIQDWFFALEDWSFKKQEKGTSTGTILRITELRHNTHIII